MPIETSDISLTEIPASLRAYLARRIVLDRLLFGGQLLGTGIALVIGWLLLAMILDRLVGLGSTLRICLLGAEVIFIAVLFVLAVRRIFRRMNLHHAAAVLEPAFDQRLETLVSQWIRPPEGGTIQPTVGELWRNIQPDLSTTSASASVRWKGLVFPWLAALLMAGVAVVLWHIPSLGLPQLSARLRHPLSAITPVTTTQLAVSPGNASVIEQSPLSIRVAAQRLGRSPPVIHFSSDTGAFAKAVMSPGDDAFVWTAPTLQKDLSYYVTGGDARTPLYHVTVLRHPSISELRVRYDYPAYTHHEPLRVITHAGPIEAPLNTRVHVDVVSLIPLSESTLQIGPQTLSASRGDSSNIRGFDFILDHDAVAHLHLVGSNGVPGEHDVSIALSAIPDQPPLAQMLQPAADIHLTPRDLLTIAWQALDDFGVETLRLEWQINNDPPHQIPLPISGDPRRCVGAVDLDLANMPLNIGDILSVALLTGDGDGHQIRTAARHILISPRSVDIDTYLRLAALRQATDLSATLANSLRSTVSAWGKMDPFAQNLAGASDAAALLRQAILQADQHAANAQTITAIAHIGDRIALISSTIEQSQIQSQTPQRLLQAADYARQVQEELNIITQGEQAAIVLADRANVREMAKTTQTDPQLRLRVEQTLSRAASEAAVGASELGIAANDPHVEAELTERVRAQQQIMTAMKPIDLLAAAGDWAKQMRDPARAPRELAGRLEMAADLEGVRINGEPVWARDLRLAGRAAHRIEETALHDPIVTPAVLAKIIADYPAALEALFHEHQNGGTSGAAARAQMKLWAAEPDLLTSAADVLNQPVAQDLAMEANALMAQRDYAGAAAVDARLAGTPEARAAQQNIIAAERQMRTAERVDQVNVEQRALAAQTNTTAPSSALARDQERVAENVEKVRRQSADAQFTPKNSRDQAMAAILNAQQQLTAMPALLANAENVQSQMRAAQGLGDQLDRFNPETFAAVSAIRANLTPALQHLDQAIAGRKPADIAAASDAARAAIAQVQSALARTQQQFAEQDPLLAAKWFAQAAAAALSRKPPDLSAAHQQQNNFAQALQNAWSTAIRQAALERLAGSATISQPLASASPPSWQAPPPSAPPANANSDPAGYAEALRMYFQKLSAERDGP